MKSLLLRQMAFGRQAFVADVKGEYGALAAAVGVTPIRLGPGLPARLNPLDPGPDTAALPAGEVTGRQLRLLVALARTALGRDVAPVEHAALGLALTAVTGTPAALAEETARDPRRTFGGVGTTGAGCRPCHRSSTLSSPPPRTRRRRCGCPRASWRRRRGTWRW